MGVLKALDDKPRGVKQVREQVRDTRAGFFLGTLWQDVRFGARMLRKTPAFTAVAILSLALGIGATSAIFSVVHAVLLRPLPFPKPQELVRVTGDATRRNQTDTGLSVPELFDLRDRTGVFDQISGLMYIDANLTGGDQPERVETLLVDANYFSLLGVKPQLGRVFTSADYRPGIAEIAVISNGLWQRRFGRDPAVIGKTVRMDNDMYTIVGVLPPEFRNPGRGLQTDVELWSPAGWVASPFLTQPVRGSHFLRGALARLKPGVKPADVQARLDRLSAELNREFPKDYPADLGWTLRAKPLQEDLVAKERPALLLLFAAVGFVLLIACANVANLLLARATSREKEIAIRAAIGADRKRLVRQLVTESLLLALVGGTLGLVVAMAGVEALATLQPSELVRLNRIEVDLPVLGVTLLIVLGSSLLFGLAPALSASRVAVSENLKEATRGTSAGSARGRMRAMFVVAQVAMAVVLLAGAGLLIRSFARLWNEHPGFDAGNMITARTWLPQPNIPESGPYFQHSRRAALYREILRRVSILPGAKQAAITTFVPLSGARSNVSFQTEDQTEGSEVPLAAIAMVSSDYFSVLGIPLRRGRFFVEQDDETGRPVALISESLTQRYFPNQDPVGKRIRPQGGRTAQPWLEIVGVVGDVHIEGLAIPPRPTIYRSAYQASSLSFGVVVRATNSPAGMVDALRREIQATDAELPVFSIRTMQEMMARDVADRRFTMTLLGLFAGGALLLAAVGLYGVMSYGVAQRTHEIGIRIALGAQRGAILRMVAAQGTRMVAAGIALGLAGTFLLGRFLTGLLFGVTATDPVTFACVVGVLAAAAAAACWIPARRATRVDPMVALRHE
jgi:putative ABC transport system permease protein